MLGLGVALNRVIFFLFSDNAAAGIRADIINDTVIMLCNEIYSSNKGK